MHPTPEPDAAIIHRMNRATHNLADHPEMYDTDSLDRYRTAALALAQEAGKQLAKRRGA